MEAEEIKEAEKTQEEINTIDSNTTPQTTEPEMEKTYAEPVETFYHASDSEIDTFDLSKTKLDQN